MNKLPTKLNTALNEASKNYAKNTSLRASVALIPYIGGSLDIIFSAKGNEIINRRINFFLKFLEESVSKLDDKKIDKVFLESEEWFDLVYRSFDEVRKTRVEEKQKIFAKILANSTLNIEKTENVEIYLRLISELSAKDLLILNYLYENENIINSDDHKIYSPFWKNLDSNLSIELNELKLSYFKLFSMGLITERYGAIMDYRGGYYKTTLLMKKLIEFIK